jgi:ribonuclease HI
MKKRKKYYAIWNGRKTGIVDNWAACKAFTTNFRNAKLKGFKTKEEAERAFKMSYEEFMGIPKSVTKKNVSSGKPAIRPIKKSVSVISNFNSYGRTFTYLIYDNETNQTIKKGGSYCDASTNTGEFIAITHALYILKNKHDLRPIYANSYAAIKWVREKRKNTKVVRTQQNEKLFYMLEKCEEFLNKKKLKNRVIKWNSKEWGNIEDGIDQNL